MKRIIPIIIVLATVSHVAAQEEQWTSYLGRPFDSVVRELKAQSAFCDTHMLASSSTLIASCLPYEFLGEKGILILRKSNSGMVKACSWIRGQYPGFSQVIESVDSARRQQLDIAPGDLDRVFSTVYNYYDHKWDHIIQSTDDGGYLWRPDQLKRKNVEYTMSRTLDYVEFTVTIREPGKQKAKPRNPEITRN